MGMRWIVGFVPLVGLSCADPRVPFVAEGNGAALVIPMVPRAIDSRWMPPPEGPLVGDDGELTYTVVDAIDVAIGDGYPTTLDVMLRAYPISGDALCGDYVEPEMTIESIDATDGGGDLVVTSPAVNQLRVTHAAEGRHTVVVRGRYRFTPPADCAAAPNEAAFALTLDVAVRRPAGVVVHLPETCAEADVPRLQSGADMALGLRMELLDADGEVFMPLNADPDRPIELRVTADAATELSTYDASLATLVATGSPTTVRVDALGDAVAFELIEPEDIDAMDVVFALPGATVTDLVPGATYGEDGWDQRPFASIQPTVLAQYSNGDALCSRPLDESFELVTDTSETCTIVADLAHGFKIVGGFLVPQSADIVADGRCDLSLRAPAFAAGAGVSAELSATFVNTDELSGGGRD